MDDFSSPVKIEEKDVESWLGSVWLLWLADRYNDVFERKENILTTA